ncbi:MAG: transporter permease [Pseudonocardiales bacterium]|nr:transporter permease [Pseudonocardiales bacterium]
MTPPCARPIWATEMHLFLQHILDGVQSGCIYAALALSIVLVFKGTGVLNFAQGEMAMFSTFLTWTAYHSGLPLIVAVLAAMAVSFLGGAAIERIILRPIAARSTDQLAVVITTIGLLLALNSLAQWIWGVDGRVLPSLFGDQIAHVGGVSFSRATAGALVLLIIVAAALGLLLHRTRLGLAMRSVAAGHQASALVGIRVGRILMFGWGLAAALGALAGALVAPTVTAFDNGLMQGVLVLAFAAATLGGFDSLPGAIIGGLVVGILESLAGAYVANDLKLAVASVVILIFLLFRPTGLFGSPRVQRV